MSHACSLGHASKGVSPVGCTQKHLPLAFMRPITWFFLSLSLLFHAGLLGTGSAFACSLVSVQASMAYAVAVSGIYWAASILLGGALIGLELYQRRGWLFPVLTVGLLMFHPYWTLPPLFGPDCVFFNVRTLLTAA